MQPVQFFKNLRQLVAEDKMDTALQQLRSLLQQSPQLDEALQQTGRWNDIRRQVRLGTVSHEVATLTKNQIRSGLLELISEIENRISSGTSSTNVVGVQNPDDIQLLREEVDRAVSIVNSKNVSTGTNTAGRDIFVWVKEALEGL